MSEELEELELGLRVVESLFTENWRGGWVGYDAVVIRGYEASRRRRG